MQHKGNSSCFVSHLYLLLLWYKVFTHWKAMTFDTSRVTFNAGILVHVYDVHSVWSQSSELKIVLSEILSVNFGLMGWFFCFFGVFFFLFLFFFFFFGGGVFDFCLFCLFWMFCVFGCLLCFCCLGRWGAFYIYIWNISRYAPIYFSVHPFDIPSAMYFQISPTYSLASSHHPTPEVFL